MSKEPFALSSSASAIDSEHAVVSGFEPAIARTTSAEREHLLLSAIVNASDDAILSKSLDGVITTWNTAAERMFGYTAEEIIGKHEPTIVPPERLQEEAVVLDGLLYLVSTGPFETIRLHKDGTPIDVSVTISPIRDAAGRIVAAAAIIRDITERKRIANALESQQVTLREINAKLIEAAIRSEDMATTDGLTGLKNHRAFQERLKEELDRALRYCSVLSLVLLDVDAFKDYNDTYGHPAGDIVLKQTAGILQREARSTDIVARYGGEEFVLILPETGAEEARQLADRLRLEIASASWEHDEVTASFGVATLSGLVPSTTELVREADKAMYRSKHRGRNCVTHFMDALEGGALDTRMAESFDALGQTVSAGPEDALSSVSRQMREMLVQSYNATIASWSRILDLRDKETEGHSKRVTAMVVRLARAIGMDEQQVMYAKWGAQHSKSRDVAALSMIQVRTAARADSRTGLRRHARR